MAKRYPPKLKFQIVLEVMKRDKSVGQIAKAYGVHLTNPRTLKVQQQNKQTAELVN